MPAYTYACTACPTRFEASHAMSESGPDACVSCASPVRKVFAAVGVVFKGSGFYKTDSRKPSPSPSAKPAAAPASS